MTNTSNPCDPAKGAVLDPALRAGNRRPQAGYGAQHFGWQVSEAGVAKLTLNRPERKNPLTFDAYAMRDLFERLRHAHDVRAFVLVGAGDNLCCGGDVHEIIGLAGCDMGACAMFPRLIGQGRASELLDTGGSLGGEEAERWGYFNRICAPATPSWRARSRSFKATEHGRRPLSTRRCHWPMSAAR